MKVRDLPGRFIVIEGADGAGKTTQAEKLADRMDAHRTHEHTDGRIGTKIDELIESDSVSPETLAITFAADRSVHLEEEIVPRLEDGETVICERYYHSSFVYQPLMGVERAWVEDLNRYLLQPDLTVILDIDPTEAFQRMRGRKEDLNRFEQETFQERVVERYRGLSDQLDERIEIIDGSGPVDTVFSSLCDVVDV
jgi:dTMP kinase